MGLIRVLYGSTLAVALSTGVAAQPAVVPLGSQVACRDCEIVLHTVAGTLARPGDLEFHWRSPITSGANGELFIAPMYSPGVIAVFDSTGHYLRRFGREGRGPGEFYPILELAATDDELFVRQVGGQLAVVTYNGEYKRAIRLPRDVMKIAVGSGDKLFGAVVPLTYQSKIRTTLVHQFDERGASVASWDGAEANVARFYDALRLVASDGSGGAWTAAINRVSMLHRASGGRLVEYRGERSWFDEWSGGDLPGEGVTSPWRPRVVGIHCDPASGLLWVLYNVVDAEWRAFSNPDEEVPRDDVVDTIIEALRIEDGSLVGMIRLDRAYAALLPNGLLLRRFQDVLGRTDYQTVRPELVVSPLQRR